MTDHTDCVFCAIIAGTIPATIIAQNDDILVIQDIAPKATIHYLILPKKHIKDVQSFGPRDCCIAGKMFKMAQQLSQEDPHAHEFRLLINSGYTVGQRVFHLHAHFLAGAIISEF
ncbi:HIT domain-containing protein [Candidatus Dependentiae bacterium]|nr:HIT domain-containing protein [Candidatus Dependentiae bacterium]